MLPRDWPFASDVDMLAPTFGSPDPEFDWGGKCREPRCRPPPVAARQAKRQSFTWAQKAILVSWLSASIPNSVRHATQADVAWLAAATDLTVRQVRVFLVNWRVRHRGHPGVNKLASPPSRLRQCASF
jgi:hypothetical protein